MGLKELGTGVLVAIIVVVAIIMITNLLGWEGFHEGGDEEEEEEEFDEEGFSVKPTKPREFRVVYIFEKDCPVCHELDKTWAQWHNLKEKHPHLIFEEHEFHALPDHPPGLAKDIADLKYVPQIWVVDTRTHKYKQVEHILNKENHMEGAEVQMQHIQEAIKSLKKMKPIGWKPGKGPRPAHTRPSKKDKLGWKPGKGPRPAHTRPSNPDHPDQVPAKPLGPAGTEHGWTGLFPARGPPSDHRPIMSGKLPGQKSEAQLSPEDAKHLAEFRASLLAMKKEHFASDVPTDEEMEEGMEDGMEGGTEEGVQEGGSWEGNFHAYTPANACQFKHYIESNLHNSPLFNPFNSNARVATYATGIVPNGLYYLNEPGTNQ